MVGMVGRGVAWLLGYEGVPFSSRLAFRYEIRHILAWSVAGAVMCPPFAALIAKKSLDAHGFAVTVIASAAAFANVVAVFWGGWALRRSKRVMLIVPAVGAGLAMGTIWLTPLARSPVVLLCGQVVLCFVCFSAVTTVRSVVWRVNYARSYRAQVAARFTVWSVLVTMGTVELVAWYLDGQVAVGAPEVRRTLWDLSWVPGAGDAAAYRNVFLAGGVFALLGAWLYRRVPVRSERGGPILAGVPTPPVGREWLEGVTAEGQGRAAGVFWPLRAGLGVLGEDAAFRDYMVWQFISGSATMMIEVPLVLILAERFQVNFFVGGTVLVFLPSLMALVATPLWARWFDQTNILRFRSRQMAVWAMGRGILAAGVATLSIPMVSAAVAVSGLGEGGGRLAWALGHMQFARRDQDALYMGVHVTLTGLRGLVMPAAGWLLYRYAIGWHIIWLTGLAQVVSVIAFWKMARGWERERAAAERAAAMAAGG